jgi:ribonuclease-3
VMTRRQKLAQTKRTESLPAAISHVFANHSLLRRALTHRSLSYEADAATVHDPASDNEQLEFVGDAVLGLIVAEALFRRFPNSREGELTRLRASLVSRRNLADTATRMKLGDLLRLGKGEEQSGGRNKPALLANTLEAVIAALYLDGGLKAAESFVEEQIVEPAMPLLRGALDGGGTFSGSIGDHKSALQELLQGNGSGQPQYLLMDQSGPDHQKRFRVQVCVADADGQLLPLAESEGSTKKQAQQEAARIALTRLVLPEKPAQQRKPLP